MEKQAILNEVKQLATQKKITLDELSAAYHEGKDETIEEITHNQDLIAQVFYYLGAIIVFIGISILLGQDWDALDFFTRLIVTLGTGFTAYLAGALFQADKKFAALGQAFFLVSALVLPLGGYVLCRYYDLNPNSDDVQTIMAGCLFVFFMFSYWLFPNIIFIIFNIIFGTWFLLSFSNFLIAGDPYFSNIDFYNYRTLLIGVVYLLLGFHYAEHDRKALANVLYSFGSFALLSTALNLSGWKPNQSLVWEGVLLIFSFLIILLSVPLKSRILVLFGTFFLMVFIIKISAEYFVNNLGWPLALVLTGLLMIFFGFIGLQFYSRSLKSVKLN